MAQTLIFIFMGNKSEMKNQLAARGKYLACGCVGFEFAFLAIAKINKERIFFYILLFALKANHIFLYEMNSEHYSIDLSTCKH